MERVKIGVVPPLHVTEEAKVPPLSAEITQELLKHWPNIGPSLVDANPNLAEISVKSAEYIRNWGLRERRAVAETPISHCPHDAGRDALDCTQRGARSDICIPQQRRRSGSGAAKRLPRRTMWRIRRRVPQPAGRLPWGSSPTPRMCKPRVC